MLWILLGAVLIVGAIFLFTPSKKKDYTFEYDLEDEDGVLLLDHIVRNAKDVKKTAKKGAKRGVKK